MENQILEKPTETPTNGIIIPSEAIINEDKAIVSEQYQKEEQKKEQRETRIVQLTKDALEVKEELQGLIKKSTTTRTNILAKDKITLETQTGGIFEFIENNDPDGVFFTNRKIETGDDGFLKSFFSKIGLNPNSRDSYDNNTIPNYYACEDELELLEKHMELLNEMMEPLADNYNIFWVRNIAIEKNEKGLGFEIAAENPITPSNLIIIEWALEQCGLEYYELVNYFDNDKHIFFKMNGKDDEPFRLYSEKETEKKLKKFFDREEQKEKSERGV